VKGIVVHVENNQSAEVGFTPSLGLDAAATRLYDGTAIPSHGVREFVV